MQVTIKVAGVNAYALGCLWCKALAQRGFKPSMAENAVASTRNRDMHTATGVRHKHTDQGKARGRLFELGIGRALRYRKADGGDEFTGFKCCGIHALEELVCRNRALVGVDGGTQGHHRAGVASRRVVVGDRATHGAHGTHLLVANASG